MLLNLSELIAGGEGQAVEFKSRFPDQARDLAKEVAAFASSNDGVILFGVEDDGTPTGLDGVGSLSARDTFTKRVQGACGAIKPPVLAELTFHEVGGGTLACVTISRGSAPLYYVQNVPYVRHLSASRPAEPQEVIDRVLAWHQKGPGPETEFLTSLGGLLVNILVRTAEAHEDERDVDPYFGELRSYLASYADDLRRNARRTPDKLEGLKERLRALANHLESAAHERITLGSGFSEYLAAVDEAHATARDIMDRWLEPTKFTAEAVATVEATARQEQLAVEELAERASDLAWSGRLDDLQNDAGRHGLTLLQLMAYGVGCNNAEVREGVRFAAKRLRAVGVRPVYMDGGASVEAIISEVKGAAESLSELLP